MCLCLVGDMRSCCKPQKQGAAAAVVAVSSMEKSAAYCSSY